MAKKILLDSNGKAVMDSSGAIMLATGVVVEENILQKLIDERGVKYLFYQSDFDSETMKSYLDKVDLSNLTSISYMFNNVGNGLKNFVCPFDTSNIEDMSYAFGYNRSLRTVDGLKTQNVTNMTSAFSNDRSLLTISLLDMRNCVQASGCFSSVESLTNLNLKNIKVNLQIGNGISWGHLLTLDSLINTIKELVDTGSSKTLTMGSANLEKIANVYVRLTGEAEEVEGLTKVPCEVCESTDEGAILITAYANSKKWTIA